MSAVVNTIRSRLLPAQSRYSTPTCVYITGSGRNGSTLLGLHLGRHRDIFFAGELTHIWRRSYLNDELCGCGEPFRRCEFWQAVSRAAFGKLSDRDARHISRLRDKVSSFWGIPSLIAARPRSEGAADGEYSAAYQALLAAISRVSGAPVIVDSSKYPTDLALLLRTNAVPLRLIHLIRDCNAVVFSWKRRRLRPEIHWKCQLMPRYSALKTALGWRLFNSAIERLSLGMGRSYTLLRYEDLIASFPDTLAQICDWLGYRRSTVPARATTSRTRFRATPAASSPEPAAYSSTTSGARGRGGLTGCSSRCSAGGRKNCMGTWGMALDKLASASAGPPGQFLVGQRSQARSAHPTN